MINYIKSKYVFWKCNYIVNSFPKCGRTWLRLILSKIFELYFQIEVDDKLRIEKYHKKNFKIPIILFYHILNPHYLKQENINNIPDQFFSKKMLFLIRDPRDILVSNFYQFKYRDKKFKGTIKDYLYSEIGSVDSIIKYYNILYENKDKFKDFKILKYEMLKKNTINEVNDFLDFLGLGYIKDSKHVKEAIEFCDFNKMKKYEKNGLFKSNKMKLIDANNENSFKVRKGQIGQYKEEFDEKDIEYINNKILRNLDDFYFFYK